MDLAAICSQLRHDRANGRCGVGADGSGETARSPARTGLERAGSGLAPDPALRRRAAHYADYFQPSSTSRYLNSPKALRATIDAKYSPGKTATQKCPQGTAQAHGC